MSSTVIQEINAALATVSDPELHRPLPDLGMVEKVEFSNGVAEIKVLLTISGCPMRDRLKTDIEKAALSVAGVTEVLIEFGVMNEEQRANIKKLLRNGREAFISFAQADSLTRVIGVASGKGGVGKTTMFRMIVTAAGLATGEAAETPDKGDIKIGETVKISYVDQSRGGIDPNLNLWEVVSDGLDFIQVGNVEIPSRAYVSTFGFKGPDQQKKAGVLSGGERNRLNLALTLKQGGNLLLLDEPTNDLDVETLGSLENALLEFPGCAVVITHDRWFLDRIATHILAYEGTDENPSYWHWFEGNFESYEANKIERLGADAAKPHSSTYRKLTRD